MTDCLGLITRRALEILGVIKAIRNIFAHQLRGLSFADPDVVKECDKLRSILKDPPEFMKDGRNVYLLATLSTHLELWSMTESIEASERRCKVPEWKTLDAWKRGEMTGGA